MILFANCKINIGLDVLRRRNDGYHDIQTVMYPVRGLADCVEVIKAPQNRVFFSSTGLRVDCPDSSNLCTRAYKLMQRIYNIGGAHIHLHKCVPFGAGLGGGSSDAATVILALNQVFELGLNMEQMEQLAAQIGSDVPFFVRNVAQMACGRGEILSNFPLALAGKHLLIVKQDVAISTATAYSGITPRVPRRTLEERLAGDIIGWRDEVTNDFEPHIFELHPTLAQTKRRLYEMGALYASMSGSGAAIYGIFDKKPNTSSEFHHRFVYQEVMS